MFPRHRDWRCGPVTQVLLNLLSNAVKFTEQGSVSFSVTREAAGGRVVTLRFRVGDTGIGILPKDQTVLFQPFVQVDSSNTRHHGGTGLGLCIAKRLVELMGETIGVASRLGKVRLFGSIFA